MKLSQIRLPKRKENYRKCLFPKLQIPENSKLINLKIPKKEYLIVKLNFLGCDLNLGKV